MCILLSGSSSTRSVTSPPQKNRCFQRQYHHSSKTIRDAQFARSMPDQSATKPHGCLIWFTRKSLAQCGALAFILTLKLKHSDVQSQVVFSLGIANLLIYRTIMRQCVNSTLLCRAKPALTCADRRQDVPDAPCGPPARGYRQHQAGLPVPD